MIRVSIRWSRWTIELFSRGFVRATFAAADSPQLIWRTLMAKNQSRSMAQIRRMCPALVGVTRTDRARPHQDRAEQRALARRTRLAPIRPWPPGEAEAEKALRRLPANTAKRIRSKLLALAADPFARNQNVKKLTGREGYRLRVGNWRALYTIDPGDEIISVLVIKPRGGAYD
jgi:mRNA interferase RelE/StbE